MSEWYQHPKETTLETLQTDADYGLSASEAKKRLDDYGLNELVEKGMKSPWAILWEQLTDVMVLILIISTIISLALGEIEDAIVIFAIVVINAALGFSQEQRAEQAIAALKKLAVPVVKVRRDGQIDEISARELVPGDVVLLEAGNLVPADGRLLEEVNLAVQEAALTGESEAVQKEISALSKRDLPLGDRRNMVYMGTIITYGRGTAVITETGMSTELGNIADLLQNVEREPTPLQKRLDGLGKTLAWVALAIIAVVLALGVLRADELNVEVFRELFLLGISMAVAAVPEGLPAVVTIALALGSQRMLKQNALIRKLPAVETLGSVTTICSDKTGTLTQNRMTVTMLDVAGKKREVASFEEIPAGKEFAEEDTTIEPPERSMVLLIKAMSLCTDAVLQSGKDGDRQAIGDPTETALLMAAEDVGLAKSELEKRWPRVAEVPFTSERKRMMTIHRSTIEAEDSTAPWRKFPFVGFSKGATDSLLDITESLWVGDKAVPLTDDWRERIQDANEKMAQNGQRVLGVAFRTMDVLPEDDDEIHALEDKLTFIGLIGMIDPPRPEVHPAVVTAKMAGIRPVMITGDHPLTARFIASELEISEMDSRYVTGRELAEMSIDDLENIVEEVPVFARVSPEHKLNIVTALQDKGHIVAMTGDGVNDAPALKKADIGVAMGITGTDVSKEAADMVLLDDNFATIVAAIEEGRTIYDNIRKFIKYTLSSNTGELWVMLVGPLLGMPFPLEAIQILWINLVTDGIPGLALTIEDSERGIMKRKPFHPNESVFSRGIGWQIIWVGILMGIVSLGMGYWLWINQGRPSEIVAGDTWRTMIFTVLTLSQMGNALAIRSSQDSLFSIGFFSNKAMVGAVVSTFLLQLALIYVPFLQNFFHTEALSLGELAIAIVGSIIVFGAIETEKWVRRQRSA